MEKSPLAKLPLEIREEIYRLTLSDIGNNGEIRLEPKSRARRQRPNSVQLQKTRNGKSMSQRKPNQLAISTTCVQVRAESLKTLFSERTLRFDISSCNKYVYGRKMRSEEGMDAGLKHLLGLLKAWINTIPSARLIRGVAFLLDPNFNPRRVKNSLMAAPWWNTISQFSTGLEPSLPRLRTLFFIKIKFEMEAPSQYGPNSDLLYDEEVGYCSDHYPECETEMAFMLPTGDRVNAAKAIIDQSEAIKAEYYHPQYFACSTCRIPDECVEKLEMIMEEVHKNIYKTEAASY